MAEQLSFNHRENVINAFLDTSKYKGSFVKIGDAAVSVQPLNRRILFPHIGYPATEDDFAISIYGHGENDLGDFVWEKLNVSKFKQSIEFTFIDNDIKNQSWYPSKDDSLKPIHALLYNIPNIKGSHYINGLLGTTDDTTALTTSSTTIRNGAVLDYLQSVPTFFSDNNHVWINYRLGCIDMIGESRRGALGLNNLNMFVRNSSYPTMSAVFNNQDLSKCIDNETYDTSTIILMGYGDNFNIHKNIKSPTSSVNMTLTKTFVSIRVLLAHLYYRAASNTSGWKSNVLDVCPAEEIDRLDNNHAELIDGMWCDINIE